MFQVRVGYVDREGTARGEGRTNWKSNTDIRTLLCVKSVASGKLLCSAGGSVQCPVMTQRAGMWGQGRREALEGEDMCAHLAESLRCTAETNTTA